MYATSDMTNSRFGSLVSLRRSRLVGWLAVLTLLFQVVLSTDHLGAAAARTFGVGALDEAVGILALCHADGSLAVAADPDDPAPGAPVPPCVLCAVAALAGNGVAAQPPVIPVVAATAPVWGPASVPASVPVRSPLRYGTERGPPIVLVV